MNISSLETSICFCDNTQILLAFKGNKRNGSHFEWCNLIQNWDKELLTASETLKKKCQNVQSVMWLLMAQHSKYICTYCDDNMLVLYAWYLNS